MADRHKSTPIRFRPPEADRLWLMEHAKRTGIPVNAILVVALDEYRARRQQGPKISGEDPEQEYRDALAELERTQRMVDRAYKAVQRGRCPQ